MTDTEKQQLRAIRETFQNGIDAINAMLSPAQNIEMQVTGRCSLLSSHAIERYRQRTGSKKGDVSVTNNIRRLCHDEFMTNENIFAAVCYVCGIAIGMIIQAFRTHRATIEMMEDTSRRIDNSNKAMILCMQAKIAASRQRVQFTNSDN